MPMVTQPHLSNLWTLLTLPQYDTPSLQDPKNFLGLLKFDNYHLREFYCMLLIFQHYCLLALCFPVCKMGML